MNSLSFDCNLSLDDNIYIESMPATETSCTVSNPHQLFHEANDSHIISNREVLTETILSNEPLSTTNTSLLISEIDQVMKVEDSLSDIQNNACTSHEIIEDLIDITPDRSKYIYYCVNCYECFSDLSGNM